MAVIRNSFFLHFNFFFRFCKIVCSLLIAAILFSCEAAERKLIWADEFDYAGLPDSSKWDYEVGHVRNNEAQFYMKRSLENSRVENGTLIIEALKDTKGYGDYTSASLITARKKSFKYGYVEVSAKLPAGRGTWPAIWLLGSNVKRVGWPSCGELDIMENVGYDSTKVYANIHTKAFNHVKKTNKGNGIRLVDPWNEFHLYAMDWTKDKIDFYVDNKLYFTYKREENFGNDEWPFDEPHYLILNLAIGGNWGGKFGIDESRFPHQFIVDYVRVYNRKDELIKRP